MIQKSEVGKMCRDFSRNIRFQRDQKGFFRMLEEDDAHEGEMPKIWISLWSCGEAMGEER